MIKVDNGEMYYEGPAIHVAIEVAHLLRKFCKEEPELTIAVCTYLADDLEKALKKSNDLAVLMACAYIQHVLSDSE